MLKADHAYYLKLGRGGEWANDAIATGRARIGWKSTPLDQIVNGRWGVIKKALAKEAKTKGAGTTDANALQLFCTSTPGDVWITFHGSKLWWARVKGPVKEDSISKYRDLVDGWHDNSEKGEALLANQIPGSIAQLQGFRGTICRVREREALLRLLSGERSPEYLDLARSKRDLVAAMGRAITRLHWKDFEILVDLVFRQSGWRRISRVGEQMRSVDLELKEPITGDQYQVQVKSRATKATVEACKKEFGATEFRKFYFFVHSPDAALCKVGNDLNDESFEVILPERLAEMVVDGGLTTWLLDKIS
jgi:hypothetical protein